MGKILPQTAIILSAGIN